VLPLRFREILIRYEVRMLARRLVPARAPTPALSEAALHPRLVNIARKDLDERRVELVIHCFYPLLA
jgi:hypothetical protein